MLTGGKMVWGFNAPAGMGMSADRMLSEKMHSNAMGSDGASFPSMPFIFPPLNGASLPSMANSNMSPMTPAGERANQLHPSHLPADAPAKQREGASTNRNGIHSTFNSKSINFEF